MGNVAELMSEHRAVLWSGVERNGVGIHRIVRAWREVTREDLNACVAALKARDTVTDPMKATKWHRTGTWRVGRIWWEWEDANKRDRLTILEELILGDGTTILNLNSENTCAVTAWVTHYMDVLALPTLPAAEPSTGTTYRLGPITKDQETGLYTTYIEKSHRNYQTVALYTSEKRTLETDKERIHLGVKDGDLNDAGAGITLLDIEQTPAGTVRRRARKRNADCTQDITEEERVAQAASAGPATSGGPLTTEEETVYRNQSAVVSPGAGAAGTINDASNSINEFALYDAKKVARTATAASGGPATSGGPLTTEEETVYRNQAAVVSPGAGAAGTINDASNSLNEFGRYDAKKVVRTATAKDSGWVSYPDAGGTSYARVFRNQDAPLTDGMALTTRNNLSFGINEFGRYDGSASRAPLAFGVGTGSDSWNFSFVNHRGETIRVFERIATGKTTIEAFIGSASAGTVIGSDSGHTTEMRPMGAYWYGKRVER